MIFRTITDDITGANKSIGLFGLSLQNVKNKLQEIQTVGFKNAIFNSSTIDKSAIDKYNQSILNGVSAQQALATASRNTNRATIALMESANGATISTEQLTAAQQASTLSSKALSMAIKTVSVAMNMIAFALIAKGIQLAADAIEHYVNRAKYAAEALEEAQQKIDDAQNSLKELSDTLEENRDRFLELSKGVDRFSHNLSLSEEEYSEYLSISQKLAELSPSLVSGYDKQGNALLDIGNSAEETASKLNEVLETQQAIAQQTLIDNIDAVADGIFYEVEDAKNTIGALKTELENLENTNVEIDIAKTAHINAGRIEYIDDGSVDNKYYEGMEKALTSAGIKFEKGGLGSTKHLQILEASPEQFENAQKFYDAMLEQERAYYSAKKAGLEKDIKEQEDIISNSYSKMSANLQAWAKDNYDYQYLSNPMQSVIDIVIPEIDWASMGDDAPKNAFEYQDYIQKHFIDPLMAVPENEKPKINSMFQKLLDFEPGDIDVVPFAEYLENELKNLGIEINLTPIVSDEQSTYNNLQKSMSDAAQKASGATDGEITSKSGRYDDYKAIYDKIEAFAKEYEIDTTEEAKAFDEALNRANGNIEKAFEYYLNRKTEDISLSFVEILSEVQGLSKGLDQMDKIYADVYDKEDFDWSSILNNEDFAEEFGNMQNVTDEYKNAYENFIETVSNSPNDLDACQSAFDDLATAYIYNSGILDKVTKETKDATIAFLEQKGVVNAEEVVLASLSGKEEAHALKEKALAITKDEVTDKTQDEINAFLDEANASETARNWLFKLITAEQVFNNQELDVSSKIKNLEALARAYGSTASAAAMSARLAYMKEQAEKSHITFNPTAADLADLQSEIDEALFKPVEIEYGGGSATKSAKDKSSKEDKQSKETIDFIEIAIKRIEEAIDKLKTKAENTFIGFEIRAKHYASLLGKVTDEINLQSQAYQAYMARANSVGLSEVYASQVRDGSLNIVDITDDKLKEQIKDYQTWYEKAKECQDKVEELKITQIELTQANLELLITKYEKLAEKVSSANDRIQGKLDLKEAWGFHATSGSYTSMNKNIIKQIDYIKKQDEELKKLLNTVEKGSEAWLEYQARLDDNKKSLQDLTKEMAENAKAVAELSGAKAERKVEKYDKSDEKLDAKIDNSIKYKNQNKYLDTEMKNIDRRQKAYDNAVKTDEKGIATTSKAINKTKSNKENKSILKKIKSLVKQKKIISESLLEKASKLGDNGALYDKCVRYNAYISAYEIDKDIADLYRKTSQQDKADIVQRKLDNIQTYYKNRQGENNQKAEQLNARIEMAKESGYVESATLYNQLSSVEKQNNASLRAERDKLQESLAKSLLDGSIKKNSDEWYEMCQQIDDVTNEIDQSDLALKQYQNTLRQMKWDSFDYLQGKISNVTSEMDFMINELSREDLTSDDIGGLTDEGNGVAYLRASKYETLKNQLADYYAELETLEKTEDQYDTKVIERKEELRQRIQDTTSAVQDEKWAIIDLYTQGYEALSNKIKDLIDEYGELLDSQKD